MEFILCGLVGLFRCCGGWLGVLGCEWCRGIVFVGGNVVLGDGCWGS